MNHAILGLLAETFIHPGAGQSGGVIDLPVARESATDYPYIAGSSLKGALADAARQDLHEDETSRLFGKPDHAGLLLVSDARLLLLPVRSLMGAYRWVTCPHLLERLARDSRRANHLAAPNAIPSIEPYHYVSPLDSSDDEKLYLEERSFLAMKNHAWAQDNAEQWINTMISLISDPSAGKRLRQRLVVINDDDFCWFCRNGLAVHARNVLNQHKQSENLWYEETLPPDTLMYSVLAERNPGHGTLSAIQTIFEKRPYLQVGGNETVGQGWFAVAWNNAER